MAEIRTVGLIGGGVIGSAWAARLLINGKDVALYDPAPDIGQRISRVLDNALRAYRRMTLAPVSVRGTLTLADSVEEAVLHADFVQESGPEEIGVKRLLMQEISRHARPEAIIASSSSGLLPSTMQEGMQYPERLIVGHPFNPVYLIPLVEIVGGRQTSAETRTRAGEFYRDIGMHPLVLRKEIAAFLSDRLMEALWRESLYLLRDDVATADELDQAIAYGPGLRWAFMGSFLTFRIAGGEGGMRHFMSQFGPSLKWPWTRFDGPDLTDELLDKIILQSDDQAAGRTITELEQMRDDSIVAVLQGLRVNDNAAGKVLAAYEEKLYRISHDPDACGSDSPDMDQPLCMHSGAVPPEWVDYNRHMTESSYLRAMGDASDALFRLVGIDEAYHESGYSYFTVETHLVNVSEAVAGERFHFTTQILDLDEKRLHVFHSMYRTRDGGLMATGEQMLLHVSTRESRAFPVREPVMSRLREIHAGHSRLARPENAGRHVGIVRKRP